MHKPISLTIFCSLIVTMGGHGAHATPAAPRVLAAPFDAPADVVQVEGGCGRGWHPGPIGGCERNWGPTWRCYWVRSPFGLRLICQ
jgi:hypothetical protein